MATEVIDLPHYTLDDYLGGTEPFEFLWNVEDPFMQTQVMQRMKIQAQAVGLRSFMAMWKAYQRSKAGTSEDQNGNVSELDLPDGKAEFQTGNYICDTDGVQLTDNYGFPIKVCPHPIVPVCRYINVDTGEELLGLWYCKYAGGQKQFERTIVVSKDDIANNITKLAKFGIVVNPKNAKSLSAYIMDIEQYNYAQIEERRSVTRLGWIGDAGEFSPYVESVRFDGEEDFGGMFNSVSQKGEYETWKTAIRKVRAEKTAARIYIAASFASVILKPCGLLPFMVHAWGGTENGKTVALMLAASVWANPELGEYVTTFNGTRYAQETKAAFLNNLPLCLDELQIQASQGKTDFDDIIYQLCEGVSKAQGKASGGLRKQLKWRNVILSNGEHPIVRDLSGGGAMNRVIEIEAPGPMYSDLVGICDVVSKNYGHAGKEFIRWLQDKQNLSNLMEIQRNYYERLKEGGATDKQTASASAILAADNIATEIIFQDDMCLTVDDMLQVLTKRDELDANLRTYSWLMDYIGMNHSHFDMDTKTEFWGTIEDGMVWFIRSVFNREMKAHGQDPRAFLSWAKRRDLIECEAPHLDKKKRFGEMSPVPRCVALKVAETEKTVGNQEKITADELPF